MEKLIKRLIGISCLHLILKIKNLIGKIPLMGHIKNLKEAVDRQLVSDVPIGAFLSEININQVVL